MKRPALNTCRTLRRLAAIMIVLNAVLKGGVVTRACNVPVFRYALERWRPDPYRATLFHRGPLNEAQQTWLRRLEGTSNKAQVNIALRMVDLDDVKDQTDREMLAARSGAQLPWLVVQYPQSLQNEKGVWSGPLDDAAVKGLVDSSLRAELIRRLADGQTAVWLMLECGNAAKDDAVATQLTEELSQLSKKLKLPELTSAPEDNLLSNAPLHVAFSLLRVPRGIATEQPLVEMLLRSESDLVEFAEPMVFPVFGRGRALLPLIGAGITADNIHESAGFLVGACSCEIKELNPGFDLLLSADWDTLLFKESPPAEVAAARTVVASGKPELVAIPVGNPSAPAAPAADMETMPETNNTASIAVVLSLLAVLVVLVKRFV